jgi:hypothetical protein
MWGGLDSNQRPTDDEFDLGRVADLLRSTKSHPDLQFGVLNLPRHFAWFRGPSRDQYGATEFASKTCATLDPCPCASGH